MSRLRLLTFSVFLFILSIGEPVFAQARFPFMGQVAGDKVSLRSGPNVNFEVITRLDKGVQLVVLSSEYGWNKVKLPSGTRAYLKREFARQLGGGVAEVTGTKVNVRSAPLINATVIGKLEKGRRFFVASTKEDWLEILPMDDFSGWVKADLIAVMEGVAVPERLYPDPPAAQAGRTEKALVAKSENAKTEVYGTLDKKDNLYFLADASGASVLLEGPEAVLKGFLGKKVVVSGTDAAFTGQEGFSRSIKVLKIQLIL
jgi:uncharacterized protein YgiM (DUF1202 family)